MRVFTMSLALVVICATAATARADEYGEWDKESYPKELVKRPLVLASGMFEVRFGAASDFVAGDSADRVRTKVDFLYALATRFQLGFESTLDAIPSDEFGVADMSLWGEYNFMPNISGRAGVVLTAPYNPVSDDRDANVGFRFGLPMQFALGDKARVVSSPSVTYIDSTSILDLPIGLQYQLLSSAAVYARTGLWTIDFGFDDDEWGLPLAGGLVLHFGRKVDLSVEFQFHDVANDSDDRWLLAFFSFRG